MVALYCVYCALCLVLGSFLRVLTPAEADAEVLCVFTESCILPCSFQGGTHVVIHWIQETAGDAAVHSYYNDQDQLARQDQRFRGRTSLFKDQISRGNASLRLTGVQFQDQGRYKCYTSILTGNKDSFINLKVDAPVHKVDIQQVENRITCSSEGIYPEPELTWSTNPPSNVAFKNTTAVQQTEQQLYNISSSLILSDSVADLVYSCTVSTRRNWRRASWRELHRTNTAGVVGGVIGAILICVIGGLAAFWIYKKMNHQNTINQEEPTNTRAGQSSNNNDQNAQPPESLPLDAVTENGENKHEGTQVPAALLK